MITEKVINELYKKYNNRPKSVDDLDISLLFESITPEHGIEIDGTDLIINSVDAFSPFHMIPLHGINAIVEFDAHVAIVLHSSIIFLLKDEPKISVHIKQMSRGMNRLLGLFKNDRALA